MTCNIEPNSNSQLCKRISIGTVFGGASGFVGLSATDFLEYISVGQLVLNPVDGGNSTPGYSLNSTISRVGLWLRNCNSVSIKGYTARNFADHTIEYVYNGGELQGDNLVIDDVDWADCNTDEVVYNSQMEILNMKHVTLRRGIVELPPGVGKVLYTESASNTVDVSGVTVS